MLEECGGVITHYTHKCHLLGKMGDWFWTSPLVGKNVARGYMAAVEVNDGWMVTGIKDFNKCSHIIVTVKIMRRTTGARGC